MRYTYRGGRLDGMQQEVAAPAPNTMRVNSYQGDVHTDQNLLEYEEYDLDVPSRAYVFRCICLRRPTCDWCDQPSTNRIIELANGARFVKHLCDIHVEH